MVTGHPIISTPYHYISKPMFRSYRPCGPTPLMGLDPCASLAGVVGVRQNRPAPVRLLLAAAQAATESPPRYSTLLSTDTTITGQVL